MPETPEQLYAHAAHDLRLRASHREVAPAGSIAGPARPQTPVYTVRLSSARRTAPATRGPSRRIAAPHSRRAGGSRRGWFRRCPPASTPRPSIESLLPHAFTRVGHPDG